MLLHLVHLLCLFAFAQLFLLSSAVDVFDQVAKEGEGVLNEAVMTGVDIRQCSCEEQQVCTDEMKNQANSCIDACWTHLSKITTRLTELKTCFDRKTNILENFLVCFERHVDSCVNSQQGARIQKTNITEIFRLAEIAVLQKADSLTTSLTPSLKRIVDTVGTFAGCVKNCFLVKNKGGFCFDRKNCQPLILEKKAKKTLKKCTRSINWKKEAGELCDCTVNAGIGELKEYCSIFRLMAPKTSSSRKPKH